MSAVRPRVAGALLGSRYRLSAPLGQGAQGSVWEAVDTRSSGALCAVKFVARAETLDAEWNALLRVEHPSLPRALDRGVTNDAVPFLVMERVSGAPLHASMGAPAALRAIADTASALAALHERGLVHGDVKPANILVTTERAYLVDLGLSGGAVYDAKSAAGTLAFMAPELLAGERAPAADLFALGVTAFAALAEVHPIVDDPSEREALLRALSRRERPRAEALARLPASVRETVASLCDPEPARRGPTTRAFLARFARDAAGSLTAAQRASTLALDAPPSLPAPMTGRDEALARVVSAVERALAGDGLGVVVSGPPGAGADRLADEAVRAARVSETARGRSPALCFSLDDVFAELDAASPRAVLLRTSGEQATADAATALARLRFYAHTPRAVVLVGTSERALATRGIHDEVLGPLDDAPLRELLTTLAGVPPSEDALRSWREATGGFAGRVVARASRMTRGTVASATGRELSSVDADGTSAKLSPPARCALALLELAGGPLDRAALLTALRAGTANESDGRTALLELAALGLAVTRESAVVAAAPSVPPSRARAHVQNLGAGVADAVTRALGVLPQAVPSLADLVVLATEPDAAALSVARRRGSDVSAPAAQRVEWLIAHRSLAPHDEGAGVLLASALVEAGRAPEAIDVIGAIDEVKSSTFSASSRDIDVASLRCDALRRVGKRDEARDLATRLAGSPGTSEAHGVFGRALLARDALDAGEPERAAEALGASPSEAAPAWAALRWHETAALTALARDLPGGATEALSRAQQIAEQTGAHVALARVSSLRGIAAQLSGDARAALGAYARAHELARDAGDAHGAATYAANLGAAHFECGSLGEALRWLDRATRDLARLGRMPELARALANLASLYSLLGDRSGAHARAERAERAAREAHDPVTEGLARVVAAESSLRGSAAGEALEAAAELTRERGATALSREALSRAVRVYAGAGDAGRARAVLARVGATDDAVGGIAALAVALAEEAPVEALRAQLALTRAAVPHEGRSPEHELALLELAIRIADRARDDAEGRRARDAYRARCAALADGLPEETAALFLDAHRPPDPLASAHARGATADVRWRRLAEITRELNSETRLRPLLERVMDAVVELTGAARGLLLLQGPDGVLRVRTARNLGRRSLGDDELALSRSVAERVAKSGEALSTVDATADQRLDAFESVHAMQLRSILAVPLLLQGRSVGTIYVDDRFRVGAFDDDALEVARDFADAAALAIQNARSDALLRRALRRAERLSRQLQRRVDRQTVELEATRRALSVGPSSLGRYDDIVGRGPAMTRALRLIDKVAPTAMPVLLQGESGTGKELLARALHANSPRAGKPFVAENCAAIPEPLLESVLFGHVKGAFTGADRTRPGLFEVAHGGTLFLDEVGEMSAAMQARLLRVLQEGELRPVGSEKSRKVDVRVVAATHRDLAAMVKAGRFREDLYYRLAVMVVPVPALRERTEDIPQLVAHMLAKHAGRSLAVEKRALARLIEAPWPGNVRQLENELMRACVLADGPLREEDLSPAVLGLPSTPVSATASQGASVTLAEGDHDLRRAVDALERSMVERALRSFRGNQSRAARALGLSRFGLQKKLKRLGMEELPAQAKD